MSTARARCLGRGVRLAFFGLALVAGVAKADLPEVVFEITAQAGSANATIPILSEWGDYDPATQTWTFDLPEALDFMGGSEHDTYLGTLSELGITIVEDPQVDVDFDVQAGPEGAEFWIASDELTFATINDPQGRVDLALTLTDNNWDGATLTGSYLAQYNGWAGNPMGPDGTTFVELFFSTSADPGGVVTEEFSYPEFGWEPIPEPAYSMSTLLNFELSAWDSAGGMGTFVIIPEPGALALLVLANLVLLRRRS